LDFVSHSFIQQNWCCSQIQRRCMMNFPFQLQIAKPVVSCGVLVSAKLISMNSHCDFLHGTQWLFLQLATKIFELNSYIVCVTLCHHSVLFFSPRIKVGHKLGASLWKPCRSFVFYVLQNRPTIASKLTRGIAILELENAYNISLCVTYGRLVFIQNGLYLLGTM